MTRLPPLLHIVLHEPEIPNNTGNIGRTCVATRCALHLIHPLGFETDVKACRRAGLDYWPRLCVAEHASWEAYLSRAKPGSLWLFSTSARRPIYDAGIRQGDHLVFGKETAGLPRELIVEHADRALVLPMAPGERSLNVATAVCAAVYEGIRQFLSRGELSLDEYARLSEPLPTATR